MTEPLDSLEDVYRAVRSAVPNVVQTATPTPAVAVVLWRRVGGSAVELYVVKRSPRLAFLGGYWSFPGGRVEAIDGEQEVRGNVGEQGELIAAGSRECREELGISLPLDADLYGHGGCWTTPEVIPIRFQAHYLLHQYVGSEPDWTCSDGELSDGRWVTSDELTSRWTSGEWLVPSPILRVARALAAHHQEVDVLGRELERQVCEEEASSRVWFPIAGVGFAPLRTPTLPPATHTNAYVIGTQEVVIIDPATPFADERSELDRELDGLLSSGRRVVEILLTHHHADHTGAADYLAERLDVKVAAHAETAARLRGRVEVSRLIEDGDVIELAGSPRRRLRALWTPGHAPGHLCFFEEESRSLVAGDMVAGIGTILIEPSDGDMGQYLESLRRLRSLDARVLLPAHGPLIADPTAKIDEYIRHRLWREARAAAALQPKGQRLDELVVEVYSDVAAGLHPIAARSLLAHLRKLENEGRAHLEDEMWRRPAAVPGDAPQ